MGKGGNFTADEVGSIYVDPGMRGRFVVSLVVSYGSEDGVETPKEALAAALRLVSDDGQDGTVWFVADRKNGSIRGYTQEDSGVVLTQCAD
jgi:hypothetical protein